VVKDPPRGFSPAAGFSIVGLRKSATMSQPVERRAQSPSASLPRPRSLVRPNAASRELSEQLEFTAFFRLEFAPVLRAVELMLRDHGRAEEITQDAFIQLLAHWTKISSYERPDAWVRRVAVRLALRSLRRDQLWQAVRTRLLPSSPDRPSRHDVDAAIRLLPGSQRAAIVLHYYEDRPTAEIAGILGCSESTARVHLHHARKRMAQLLGEADDVA
jgi:RNA polymerase sigma factor (sigma-70 family)